MPIFHCPHCELNQTFATIGFLVCEFANFEGRLAPVLALMLDDNGDQASAILGQIDSFALKWSAVIGVAETRKGEAKIADVVLSIIEDVERFKRFRNKLAHGGSRIHDADLWLIVNATTTKRSAPKSERITNDAVQASLDSIRHCISALDAEIDWTKLTSNSGLMRGFRCESGSKGTEIGTQ